MQAGQLNRKIVIQNLVQIRDEYNELIGSWEDFASVWANVKMLSGLETVKANADVSVTKASIRIRYRTDITAGMRAVCDGLVFDIRAVMPDVAGRVYTDLAVEQGANEG